MTLTAEMWPAASTVVVVLATVFGASAYQPWQAYDTAAVNFQRQPQQWQRHVPQRSPYTSYSVPWATRGYGLHTYRQDGVSEALPPQPTIVAPTPAPGQGQLDSVAPVQEVNNQVGVEQSQTAAVSGGHQNPLRALCKGPRGQFSGSSCGKFVNCWDDVVIEQDCPFGLYFNEKVGYCDFAWNVACNSQPIYQPDSVEGPPGSSVEAVGQSPDLGTPGAKCPTEFGTYRSNRNCGVFYMCVGYQPFEFTCPGGLNFHKDLQVCDYPYRVECNGVPSNQPPPPPETTLMPEGETAPPAVPTAPAEYAPPAPLESAAQLPPSPTVVAPEPTPVVPTQAFYNLRKVPASLVNSGVPCRPNSVYRLDPSCSSVAVCRSGYTQVLNCGPGTSYDVNSDGCVPFLRARC